MLGYWANGFVAYAACMYVTLVTAGQLLKFADLI